MGNGGQLLSAIAICPECWWPDWCLGVWSRVWPLSTDHAAHAAGGRPTPAVSAAVLARHHIPRLVRSDVRPIVTLMDGEL